MPRFFIDRPIFAWVIALFILVLGGETFLPFKSESSKSGATRFWLA